MLSLLTFNAALQDVQLLGRSVYYPVDFVQQRAQKISRQLKRINPDIICLQELFHPHIQEQIYAKLKEDYPYSAGLFVKNYRFRLGNELIIFSKYPLRDGGLTRFNAASIEERIFTSKGFYKVSIDGPAGEIEIINIHMTAGGLFNHPEDEKMESIRSDQITQLINAVTDDKPTLLAGDLNAGPVTSFINYQSVLNSGFTDAFVTAGGTGITWDPENPLVAKGNESKLPEQRIDHVFLNQAALELYMPVKSEIVFNDSTIHLADRTSIPLSDHYAVLVLFKY